jgi:hypothetical protein
MDKAKKVTKVMTALKKIKGYYEGMKTSSAQKVYS